MNTLILLSIILLVLMLIIGGRKGLRSFLSLSFNFIVFIIALIFMMAPSANPIIITILACLAISCINLFYINEINSKTKIAFISTMITIILLLFIIYFAAENLMIQGFGEEQIEELSVFSFYIGIDFVQIAASMIIMSTVGAIIDIAISITSPMSEIYNMNPQIKREALFLSGIRIGRDILGSNTNTLFFAFFGSYFALLIWIKDMTYSVGEVINSKIINSEVIIILSAGIGIALVIPIAAWMNAYYITRQRDKQ